MEREVGGERIQPEGDIALPRLELADAAGQRIDLAGELRLLGARRGDPALQDAEALVGAGRAGREQEKEETKKRTPECAAGDAASSAAGYRAEKTGAAVGEESRHPRA